MLCEIRNMSYCEITSFVLHYENHITCNVTLCETILCEITSFRITRNIQYQLYKIMLIFQLETDVFDTYLLKPAV